MADDFDAMNAADDAEADAQLAFLANAGPTT